jgi:hypothetical protein
MACRVLSVRFFAAAPHYLRRSARQHPSFLLLLALVLALLLAFLALASSPITAPGRGIWP